MLLPRFSLRTMLLIAAGVAVASVFAGQAVGGRVWAVGFVVALVSTAAALVMQAAFFALGTAAARWLGPQEIVARTSRGGVERTTVAHAPAAPSPAMPPAGQS